MAQAVSGGGLGKSMALVAVSNFIVPASALVTAPLLARALGVDGRGELAAATAPLLLMTVAATFGVPEAVTFYTARRFRAGPVLFQGFQVAFSLACLAAVGVFFAAPMLAAGNEAVGALIALLAIAIPFSVTVGLLRASAAGRHQWRAVASEKLINGSFRILLTTFLFVSGSLTLETAALTVAIPPLVSMVAYAPMLASRGSVPSNAFVEPPPRRSHIARYGARVWVGSVAGILLVRLNQLLMLPLAGAGQLGLFAVAVNVADVTLLVNSALRDVTLASDSAKRDNARLSATARVSLLVSALMGAGIAATLPWWLEPLFGTGFGEAALPAMLLILASVLGAPGSVIGAGLSARGRPGVRSTGMVISLLLNVVTLVVLVPSLGATGAALAAIVGNVVASNFNVFAFQRIFRLPWHAAYLVRPSDIVLLWSVAMRILRRHP